MRPSTAAATSSSDSVVTTDSVPLSERAATPAARRITSPGHSSRGLPSPTASTLATGSDGATTRVVESLPPLAPSAFSATSISPTASASRNGLASTRACSPSPVTTGTTSTAEPMPRLGSEAETVTVGDW